MKDSNPHEQSQSLVCYLYTNPLYVPAVAGAGIIIANETHLSTQNFRKNKFFIYAFLFPVRGNSNFRM